MPRKTKIQVWKSKEMNYFLIRIGRKYEIELDTTENAQCRIYQSQSIREKLLPTICYLLEEN